jgi:glycine/D-amino acid oxidase-like deaminating enzyme
MSQCPVTADKERAVESDLRKATRFATGAGNRLADEALSLVRTTGRRAVLRTFHRAQARATGREATPLHWPRPELAPHYDVIVAGGTLPGLWLAWELARRGELRVAVVERGLVGTSWPSRAGYLLSPLRDTPGLSAAVARSCQLYEETYTDYGFRHRLGRTDVVRLATDAAAVRQLQRLVAENQLSAGGAELVDPRAAIDLVDHLDPEVALGAVIEHGIMTVEADVLPWELGGDAAERGTAVVERCAINAVSRSGESWLLETAQGATEAGVLVDATPGAEILNAAGVAHRCLWRRWETLYTDPVQPFLHAHLLVQGVEVAQTTQGEIRLTTPSVPAPPGPTRPSLDAAAAASSAAVRALPPLSRLRLVAQMAQAELLASDGVPVAGDQGATFGSPGLHRLGGLGPDAVALAPALAEALVSVLIGERPPSWLEACRPERLAGMGRRNGAATAGTAG